MSKTSNVNDEMDNISENIDKVTLAEDGDISTNDMIRSSDINKIKSILSDINDPILKASLKDIIKNPTNRPNRSAVFNDKLVVRITATKSRASYIEPWRNCNFEMRVRERIGTGFVIPWNNRSGRDYEVRILTIYHVVNNATTVFAREAYGPESVCCDGKSLLILNLFRTSKIFISTLTNDSFTFVYVHINNY